MIVRRTCYRNRLRPYDTNLDESANSLAPVISSTPCNHKLTMLIAVIGRSLDLFVNHDTLARARHIEFETGTSVTKVAVVADVRCEDNRLATAHAAANIWSGTG